MKKSNLTSRWSLRVPLYVEKTDKRYKKYVQQLKESGFSSTETWNLYGVVAEFVLPRLKRFREVNNGYPPNLSESKWNDTLDKMIFSFEWALICDKNDLKEKELKNCWKKYNEGMKLFAEYFIDLWW